MCGIIGIATTGPGADTVPVLIEGLRRLEYRGYDSAGIAVMGDDGNIHRSRSVGRVRELEKRLEQLPQAARAGIAHTRWATHGAPTICNAHPHVCNQTVALVHNGIIENHEELRRRQHDAGFRFTSETDTEVVVHEIHAELARSHDLLEAVRTTVGRLHGAYALGVIAGGEPGRIVGARRGSPLIVGHGDDSACIVSDISALLHVTRRYSVLEEGDVVDIRGAEVRVYDENGQAVEREVRVTTRSRDAIELGDYRHFMEKEIFEQGRAVADTLEERITAGQLLEEAFGPDSPALFDRVRHVKIVACGTSYYAGLVARYWLEARGVPCNVEVASEFRYRPQGAPPDALILTISQSGETIDTLEALRYARRIGYRDAMCICNVAESSLVRESDYVFLTRAGPEIAVASTKAFTTQLTALLLLVIALGRRASPDEAAENRMVHELRGLPSAIAHALEHSETVRGLAEQFADKHHALYLGRGVHYPVALEGALKLKEISYIHAEAYPAGELKHGPLALVNDDMPVIAVAPNNELLVKLRSNIQEVRARGGRLLVFTDGDAGIGGDGIEVVNVSSGGEFISPIIHAIPLQLLAYHIAVIKGTDVDKPRNLAKSVTVE